MRLGIDFGTTRTRVAVADRGNYPVVTFIDDADEAHEYFPSVVAELDGELVHGFEALTAAREGAPLLRSFKRLLGRTDVTAQTPVTVGATTIALHALLSDYLAALMEALRRRSNVPRLTRRAAVEAVVAVPAHAHLAQRFLTLQAFQRAGFVVKALMNEPSAAGFEFTHRQARTLSQKRTHVLVYDLGGGTFDASLVRVDGTHHEVLATAGLPHLGGDDFDALLAVLALQDADLAPHELAEGQRRLLLDAAREAKERITPNSRRIIVDGPVTATVAVDRFYAAATPLVERTLDAMAPLFGAPSGDAIEDHALGELAGIYLVGGASGLPLVPRMLKERFGRRVHRSPYPAASTAMGLAIAADEQRGFTISERYARTFGVFRERDSGRALAFDPIITPDMSLPDRGVTIVQRRYRAAHNIGHFRFVEIRAATPEDSAEQNDTLTGELLPVGEILFPFDPGLHNCADLQPLPVERCEAGAFIEERYLIDPNGLVRVEIEDLETGFVRLFSLDTTTH